MTSVFKETLPILQTGTPLGVRVDGCVEYHQTYIYFEERFSNDLSFSKKIFSY
ncbi:MAG: hypothetical protein U9O98_07495 [Asgard group archaeon]|nr:hypothetical protein [Asgard group archaeon]